MIKRSRYIMKNEKAFVLMKHGGLLHGNAWDLNMLGVLGSTRYMLGNSRNMMWD
jgi:hypothetical protein